MVFLVETIFYLPYLSHVFSCFDLYFWTTFGNKLHEVQELYCCLIHVCYFSFCRVKADELIKLISDSTCPQSISIAMFAQKVKSWSTSTGIFSFGVSYDVIVFTSFSFSFSLSGGAWTGADVGSLEFAYVYACRKLWVLDAAVD